jgi:hypothetical protein
VAHADVADAVSLRRDFEYSLPLFVIAGRDPAIHADAQPL